MRVIQGNVLLSGAVLAVPNTGAVQVSMQGWKSILSPFVRRRAQDRGGELEKVVGW